MREVGARSDEWKKEARSDEKSGERRNSSSGLLVAVAPSLAQEVPGIYVRREWPLVDEYGVCVSRVKTFHLASALAKVNFREK